MIIDGKAVAARVKQEVAREVAELSVTPGLATVLVGDDPASAIYVRMKREDCAEVGIESFHHAVPGDVEPGELSDLLKRLNADERVHGILLQLPLRTPEPDEFIALIDPVKDVDGLTSANAGLLMMQDREEAWWLQPGGGVMELLREADVELEGARAVVIGRRSWSASPWRSCCWAPTPPSRTATRARATCPRSAVRRTC